MSRIDIKIMNAWFVVLFAYSCWREVRGSAGQSP
jgi:hypothetical protein